MAGTKPGHDEYRIILNRKRYWRIGIGGRGIDANSGSAGGAAVVCNGGSTCRGM
jgi:hypothetical protein